MNIKVDSSLYGWYVYDYSSHKYLSVDLTWHPHMGCGGGTYFKTAKGAEEAVNKLKGKEQMYENKYYFVQNHGSSEWKIAKFGGVYFKLNGGYYKPDELIVGELVKMPSQKISEVKAGQEFTINGERFIMADNGHGVGCYKYNYLCIDSKAGWVHRLCGTDDGNLEVTF